MRVTKAMLEETNDLLRSSIERITAEKMQLEKEVKLLRGVIDTYSRMTPLIIAAERISDALVHTVTEVSRNGRRN